MDATGGVTVVAAELVGGCILGTYDVFYSNFKVILCAVTSELTGTRQHEGSSATPCLQDGDHSRIITQQKGHVIAQQRGP